MIYVCLSVPQNKFSAWKNIELITSCVFLVSVFNSYRRSHLAQKNSGQKEGSTALSQYAVIIIVSICLFLIFSVRFEILQARNSGHPVNNHTQNAQQLACSCHYKINIYDFRIFSHCNIYFGCVEEQRKWFVSHRDYE